jgi:hypothetical protein
MVVQNVLEKEKLTKEKTCTSSPWGKNILRQMHSQ